VEAEDPPVWRFFSCSDHSWGTGSVYPSSHLTTSPLRGSVMPRPKSPITHRHQAILRCYQSGMPISAILSRFSIYPVQLYRLLHRIEKETGERVIRSSSRRLYTCVNCGRVVPRYPSQAHLTRFYCSRECWLSSSRVSVPCAFCHRPVTIRRGDLNKKQRFFCDRLCRELYYADRRLDKEDAERAKREW